MKNLVEISKWNTWGEIQSQPEIWSAWANSFNPVEWRTWISGLDIDQIWLCGAGTSAYIGDIIAAQFPVNICPQIRSIPSTDLVAQPCMYLKGAARPLIINFGRSGNSSESLGTLDAIAALAPMTPTLNITCNPQGTLANTPKTDINRTIVLPAATHDSGFAMTSSFSTMLLTALSLIDETADFPIKIKQLADDMKSALTLFQNHDEPLPERVVFLGTGPMAFAAREAALKVLELTAGQIPTLWDSVLGFRHGPKSFVNDATLNIVFLSADPHTMQYETDLISELGIQFPNARCITVGPNGDFKVKTCDTAAWSAPIVIGLAQVLAVRWAQQLGLNVDNPFDGQGTLSRVVSGVTLYEISKC